MHCILALCQARKDVPDGNGLMAPAEEDRQAVWDLGPRTWGGISAGVSSGLGKVSKGLIISNPSRAGKGVCILGPGPAVVATNGGDREPEVAAGSYKRAVL